MGRRWARAHLENAVHKLEAVVGDLLAAIGVARPQERADQRGGRKDHAEHLGGVSRSAPAQAERAWMPLPLKFCASEYECGAPSSSVDMAARRRVKSGRTRARGTRKHCWQGLNSVRPLHVQALSSMSLCLRRSGAAHLWRQSYGSQGSKSQRAGSLFAMRAAAVLALALLALAACHAAKNTSKGDKKTAAKGSAAKKSGNGVCRPQSHTPFTAQQKVRFFRDSADFKKFTSEEIKRMETVFAALAPASAAHRPRSSVFKLPEEAGVACAEKDYLKCYALFAIFAERQPTMTEAHPSVIAAVAHDAQGFTNAGAALEYAYRFEDAERVYENALELFSAPADRNKIFVGLMQNRQNQAHLAFGNDMYFCAARAGSRRLTPARPEVALTKYMQIAEMPIAKEKLPEIYINIGTILVCIGCATVLSDKPLQEKLRRFRDAEEIYIKAAELTQYKDVKALNNVCRSNLGWVGSPTGHTQVTPPQIQPSMHGRFDVSYEERLAGFNMGKKFCNLAVQADPKNAEANMNVCGTAHCLARVIASAAGHTVQGRTGL